MLSSMAANVVGVMCLEKREVSFMCYVLLREHMRTYVEVKLAREYHLEAQCVVTLMLLAKL